MKRRLFVAIPIPADLAEAYRGYGRANAGRWPGARWTGTENLHVTLCFIGDVEESRLPDLTAALGTAAGTAEPFSLVHSGVVPAPPGRRPPTMIWAVLEGGAAYARLARAARQAAEPFATALPAAKELRPHVTLARFSDRTRTVRAATPARLEPAPSPFPVESFRLVESRLTPTGPIYATVSTYLIKKDT